MLIAVAYVRSGPFHSLTSRMNAFLYSLLISCSHGSVFATHHESERAGVGVLVVYVSYHRRLFVYVVTLGIQMVPHFTTVWVHGCGELSGCFKFMSAVSVSKNSWGG